MGLPITYVEFSSALKSIS